MSDDTRDLAAFRLQAGSRPDARQLFVVRRGVFLHLGPHGHLPDVLSGIWRGRAGLLLDLAARFSRPGGGRSLFCRAGGSISALRRGLPVVAQAQQLAALGWMAGWVYLCGAVISLAAVALAFKRRFPRSRRRFSSSVIPPIVRAPPPTPSCWGACLIAVSTVINSIGVRHLARINNIGVIAELCGVGLLIVLLAAAFAAGRRSCSTRWGKDDGQTRRLPGPVSGGGAHGVLRDVRVRHGRVPWPRRPASLAGGLPGRSCRHWPPPALAGRPADSLWNSRRQRPRPRPSWAGSRAACRSSSRTSWERSSACFCSSR